MKKLSQKYRPPRKLFEYSSLDSEEIRLLKIRPGSGNLSGDLITIRLSDVDSTSPIEYEALSYFWGVKRPTKVIQINYDFWLWIKPNLEDALRTIAKRPMESLLWIDAICINQDNNLEKNHQVQLMKLRYQRAQGVLVWIKSPGFISSESKIFTTTTEALQQLANAHRLGRDSKWLAHYLESMSLELNQHASALELLHVKNIKLWHVLVRFFDHDWWRRVWVRQEIAMSQNATVLCGNSTVDWKDVAAVSHWLKLFWTDLDSKTREGGTKHRSGVYSGEDLEFFRQTLEREGYGLDFLTMLNHARNCEASDPRDIVFAILGMIKESQDICVDYNQPVAEIAKQAFRKLVSESGGLESLIFSQNPQCNGGIPSWAPDLYSEFSAQPSRSTNRSSSLYCASDSLREASCFFLGEGNTLTMSVNFFDSVQKTSPAYPTKMSSYALNKAVKTARECVFEWLVNMRIDQKYELLMRTLTRDRDIRGRRLMSNADGLDWGRFFRIEHLGVGVTTEFQYLARAIRQFQGPADDEEESVAWLRLCAEAIQNRRVVMTEGERIGLVPAETEPLDVLCIMDGLDVPLVLRKRDSGSYILIGEAYIHGAMDGEIKAPAQVIDVE